MNRSSSHTEREPVLMAWDIGWRHRFRFVLTAFIVCVAVLAASLALPRKYRAEATFESRTDMVMAEIFNRGVTQNFNDPRASLAKELSGPAAIDEIIEQLRQDPSLRQRFKIDAGELESLRHELERKITLKYEIASNNLDQVTISYVTTNRPFAPWAVNQLIENYIRRARTQTDQRLNESVAFFTQECQRARQTIENLENQKLAFEIQHSGLLPDSPFGLQSSMAELRLELSELERQRESARLRIDSITESLAAAPALIPASAAPLTSSNPLEQELRQTEMRLSECLTSLRMTERHPDVVALRQKIASIRAQLGQGQTSQTVAAPLMITNPKRQELDLLLTKAKADFEAYEKGCAQLRQRIEAANSQSEQLFPVRAEYQKLTRQIDEAQRQLGFWEDNLRRVEVVRAAANGDRGIQLRVLKPAANPQAVSPRMAQVMTAALLLALAAGALAVFLSHQSDQTFHRSSDLAEATSLPIFGTVSELESERQQRLARLRTMVLYPLNAAAMAGVLALMVALVYFSLHKPGTLSQDTVRPTAQQQQQQPVSAPPLSAAQGGD